MAKDARKVLVIPNITNSRNPDADSFIDVIHNHITALESLGNYHWHIVLREHIGRLDLPNVSQHIVPISGDMIHMRVVFPKEVIKLLLNLDYDVIYSHLPDWYMVKRYTQKPIYGYAHWWELKTSNPEDRKNRSRNIPAEIIGTLHMEKCFLNTYDQKNRVLNEASVWFNDDKVSQLDSILEVWHLGVPSDHIVERPARKIKEIVFNHRAAGYKGYPKFIQMMKEYRETRKDFIVWVPQLKGLPDEKWIDNTKVDKKDYYKRLARAVAGVQMRQKNYGWSVAATDCMMNGTPVVFQDSDCYREIDPNGLFFKRKDKFFEILDRLLDEPKYRRYHSIRSIERSWQLHEEDNHMIRKLHGHLSP